MSVGRTGVEKALNLLKKLPRVALDNIKPLPEAKKKRIRGRGQHGGKQHFHKVKGAIKHQHYTRLGFEGGSVPFYLRIPREFYYKGHHLRRQYPPISLYDLQLMIDLNQLDTSEPVDLTTICNTRLFNLRPFERHYGFQITDQGADRFSAKINLEAQWLTEPVIAAVERNGGTVTTAYYDILSIQAAMDPLKFFETGNPIPRRFLPSQDCIEYYTDPNFRGYLADPDQVAEARLRLAQKFGYELPDIDKDPQRDVLLRRKDPRQIFYGLEPGWVVNLKCKKILKPKDPEIIEYYRS